MIKYLLSNITVDCFEYTMAYPGSAVDIQGDAAQKFISSLNILGLKQGRSIPGYH